MHRIMQSSTLFNTRAFSIPHQETLLCISSHSLYSSLLSLRQTMVHFLSLQICVQLLPFSLMFSKSIHFAACVCSIHTLHFGCVFIRDRCFDCFHFLTIMNSMNVDSSVQIFVIIYSFGYKQEREMASQDTLLQYLEDNIRQYLSTS